MKKLKKSNETEVRLATPAARRRKRFKKAATLVLLCATAFCCMALPCFADSNTELQTTMKNITTAVTLVGAGMDVIFGVWIGIKCGRGGQKLQEAKGQMIGLVIGVILTFGASKIVDWIKGMSAFTA